MIAVGARIIADTFQEMPWLSEGLAEEIFRKMYAAKDCQ